MKLLLLSALLVSHLALLIISPAAEAEKLRECRFPAIFNFGDSNSDTGGLSAALGHLNLPFGETFFEKPVGRYSDGRLVIDFIAESFGLPFLSPYLDSLGSNFSYGASFATAASTIVPQNLSLSQGGYSPFHLGIQLTQFLQLKSGPPINHRKGSVLKSLMPAKEVYSRALYTIDIGQNDMTALFELNISSDSYIPDALMQLSQRIKSLYHGNGGRYFWIHNTGPLGCLPYALLRAPPTTAPQLDAAGCSVFFNKLAQKYNRMLNETVISLRKKLPKANFILVDMYSVKYSLFTNASKYGFEEPLKSCCGYGDGKYNFDFTVRCGWPVKVENGTGVLVARACERPQKRVIWDGIHYTDAANKFVFDRISTGDFSDPPIALSKACINPTKIS